MTMNAPIRIRYLPIERAEAGMVLGDRVSDNHLRPLLPSGAVITDENLRQMQAHQVEFVCIAVADDRSAQAIAEETELARKRLERVFIHADRRAPHVDALFDQLLMYRSA
jgi:hypothetical protein